MPKKARKVETATAELEPLLRSYVLRRLQDKTGGKPAKSVKTRRKKLRSR